MICLQKIQLTRNIFTMTTRNTFNAIIAGGGASGLFCALLLAKAGKKVLIFESQAQCGRKLAATGGGYANFSNIQLDCEHYSSPANHSFAMDALAEFDANAIIKFITDWKLPYEMREQGRLFLKVPAKKLVTALIKNCMEYNVAISTSQKVRAIKKTGTIYTAVCQELQAAAPNLVLAVGSGAHPSLGGADNPWGLPAQAGLHINAPKPALTPLLFTEAGQKQLFGALTGISVEATVTVGEHSWRDKLLFTHHGLSGPAILNASLYYHDKIKINFLPDLNLESLLDSCPRQTPRSTLRRHLPVRLVDTLLPENLANCKNGQISRSNRQLLAKLTHDFEITSLKPAGFSHAEVCSGGVCLDQISPKTMECRFSPGLYVTGEALDVTGELGGYNLHWAWASAWLAARHILTARVSA